MKIRKNASAEAAVRDIRKRAAQIKREWSAACDQIKHLSGSDATSIRAREALLFAHARDLHESANIIARLAGLPQIDFVELGR